MPDQNKENYIDFSDLAYELIAPLDWDQAIKTVLSRIGRRLLADQVEMQILDPETKVFTQKSLWSKDSKNIADLKLLPDRVPWIMDQMWQSNIVLLPDTKDLSENIPKTDHEWIRSINLNSLLLMPLPLNRTLGGVIVIKDPQLKLSDFEKIDSQFRSIAQALGRAFLFYQKYKNQNQLSFQDSFYSQLIHSLDEALLIFDKDKKILGANNGFNKFFGKEVNTFIGKELNSISDILPENCLQLIDTAVGFDRIGVSPRPTEMQIQSAKGETKDLEMFVSTIKEDANIKIVVIWRDITYRKGMQRLSQESEAKLKLVLESVKEGITLSDSKGYFEIFNSEMEALTGFTRQEANQAKDFMDLIHQNQTKDEALSRLSQVQVGQKLVGNSEIQSKNGEKKYVSVSTTLIQNQGKDYYLSAFHDQTREKLIQEELNTQNKALEILTDQLKDARDGLEEKVKEKTKELQYKVEENQSLAKFPSEDPFPVLRIGFDGKLLYANSASKALLDVWQSKINDNVPDGWKQLIDEVAQTNSRKIYEIEILGQVISFVLVPVTSADYVNMYGRDVSREKEIDQMKNQFISMVSHQIRTPLTSVRWYSEMLLKGKDENILNSHQKDLTETIHETAVTLTELVNDLLSISRMESGKIDYNPSVQNLTEVVESVIKELKPQADQSGVRIEFNSDSFESFAFDPKLILEVYRNLISNAVKYTLKEGKVNVSLKKEADHVLTTIVDTGIGIPKSAQENVFERFYRAQNAVDLEFEGTGLGLSVAKMIVEKAGGKIWFESEENKGTTFFFTLPLQNMI